MTLALAPGEVVRFQGPSGSGKTSLLRAVARLDDAAGTMWLDGAPAAAIPVPRWRTRVALVGATPVGAGERIASWLERPRRFEAQAGRFDRDRLDGELDALGLADVDRNGTVDGLSTGEQQRLRLARALAGGPEVLLLDEPTSHLDPALADRLWCRVDRFLDAGGAVVCVSHRAERGRVIELPSEGVG